MLKNKMSMAAPTRLVFCITELDPGGAERALTRLVMNLDRAEWDPFVICLGPRAYFAEVLEMAGIPVTCLNANGVLSLPRVLFQLVRELRRLKPALFQTFLFHANVLGRIAARLAGIRHVICAIRVAEHRSSWYGAIDRWTNFLVTQNVCVSQGVADFSKNQVGLDELKLIVIPNSVDVDRFARAQPADLGQFGIPVGSRVLISIGRLERQKGIDVLLDAIVLLIPNGVPAPNSSLEAASEPFPTDTHFLIVGDGPDSNSLREQAVADGLFGRVHFAGRQENVPELLAASTALILPSRWEGMPNVVLEAMAAARPVIASRVEGIAELVQDGVTGLVVTPEQPADLADAIRSLLKAPDFIKLAGKTSQNIVQKHFTEHAVSSAYTKLYRETLAKE